MAEVTRLTEALHLLTQTLDELGIPYTVIGGVANLVWGEPRITQDIDVTISVADNSVDGMVRALGERLTILADDPIDFLRATRVLPLVTAGGVRIDLIRAGLPYEEEAIRRGRLLELGGARVRVASAEDLILHKLASEPARDREDVAGVIRRQRGALERTYLDPLVQSLADTLEQPEIWDWYLAEVNG